MEIKAYAGYIKECRKGGFDDIAIKESLIAKNWPEREIDRAFAYLNKTEIKKEVRGHEELSREIDEEVKEKEQEFGNSVVIFLDSDLKNALEKRAKKNMFTLPEQVEDILRRSTLNMKGKKSIGDEKLDDKLVGLFSRKNTGQKAKKKKVKIQKRHARKDRKKARKQKRLKKKAERRAKKRR